MKSYSDAALSDLNEQMEGWHPVEIIWWACRNYGTSLAATSSLQTQSLPFLWFLTKTNPGLPVFFLDTGFHFPETLEYRDYLRRQLGLNIQTLSSGTTDREFIREKGKMFESNPDMCCYLNKVAPLEKGLEPYSAWMAGIRRDQSVHRASQKFLSHDQQGRLKICPMLRVTGELVNKFIDRRDFRKHPLYHRGYRSIGCYPCTKATSFDANERDGRWSGSKKTECGLHLNNEYKTKK